MSGGKKLGTCRQPIGQWCRLHEPPCLPEVAGDAAEYFEPTSVDDLAAAMERVLGPAELQETLRRKGLERVKLFSWDECVRRNCEVYRRVLQE
jgi:glycosyltransferase involved in cell wall biosynthesis